MKLTFRPDKAALDELERLAEIPANLLEIGTDEAKRRQLQEIVLAGFLDNFAEERAGDAYAWAELKPSTNLQRHLQGYDPYHPILYRTGSYKGSWVDEGNAEHISGLELTSNGFIIAEGSSDYRAPYHEEGTPNMAARSVSRLSQARQNQIGAALARLVIAAIESEG